MTSHATAQVPRRISALIYDFDDTIVESERMNDSLFAEVLRRDFGISLSPNELDLVYGFSWTGVFEWLTANHGLGSGREQVWTRFIELKRDLLRGKKLRVATGLDRMLSLPVAQAIVSGSTRVELAMMMENIGLAADSLAFVLSDEDCVRGKPDPEGYLMALDRLGVPAEEAIVFEDSPAGIEAARRAGITAAFVAELASRNSAADADVHFATMMDAWTVVKERVGTVAGSPDTLRQ
jgi:beta-phosphoglucomutase-like phosphatase (HAD superfamily)